VISLARLVKTSSLVKVSQPARLDAMKALQVLRKLSLAELWVRGSQALTALAERRGWSALSKIPKDSQLMSKLNAGGGDRRPLTDRVVLDRFRARTTPKFFTGLLDRDLTLGVLRNRSPQIETLIIKKADKVLEGRFDLLGLRDLSFGDSIDWHLEPQSGKRTQLLHWSKLDYLDPDLVGDKKILWELNRHQYFVTLGQAYWFTNNERYAQTFINHLQSWMDQNPPKLGINWASSLELAFRSISWIWGLYFFRNSASLTPAIFIRVLKFLYLHARHLETYLSTYFSPNTHLTGEALGLFYLGTLLPEFHEARRWRETGRSILLEQLPRHVKPDGVYFEQSSYYHRYTTDFYIHFLILSRLNNQSVPAMVEEKLRLLLDHLMYLTKPDGMTPFFGDDDGGRLLTIDERGANDFRAPLSTCAVLFERGDYKYVAGKAAEETLWLLGLDGIEKFDLIEPQKPNRTSVGFEDGGYYVMRDGWTPTANYLLFDCGPHGAANCGHAHADALSFEVSANGKNLLVDPGTYTYTGSKEFRDWFRNSAAHNTLTLDGRSSSISAGPFSWKTTAQCRLIDWISQARFDYVSAEHDGYSSLPDPAMHIRSILFLKKFYWLVVDRVVSMGKHRLDLRFHPSIGTKPRIISSGTVQLYKAHSAGPVLEIVTFAASGTWQNEDGWISSWYGQKERALVSVFSTTVEGPAELITFMLPVDRDSETVDVSEIEANGGRAFELTRGKNVDVVMLAGFPNRTAGKRIETARMASDFNYLWARFAGANASFPEEVVALGGQSVRFKGHEVFSSKRPINYLVAKRAGEQFQVETDGI